MVAEFEALRSELEGKLQPPIDVMLDPSLLTAETSRGRLADSTLFEAHTQATLSSSSTGPRVDRLYVPQAFLELLEGKSQADPIATAAWNLFRGRADGASTDKIIELLDSHDVKGHDGDIGFSVNWTAALKAERLTERLTSILAQIGGFLANGGVLLSRTSASLDAIRDAGTTTVDLGSAELEPRFRKNLFEIGYQEPAPICAFGLASASDVAIHLVGDLLSNRESVLVYRLGA